MSKTKQYSPEVKERAVRPASKSWSASDISQLIDKHGPVEALLHLDNGWQHNIVLIGVDKDRDKVIYHDPAVGLSRSMSVAKFNDTFCWEYHRSALTAYKNHS